MNQQARASYDEAVANYLKTALTAYQEVEDNLAALRHLADEVAADEAASKSAASASNHSDRRNDEGVADYIEVTTTHTAALQEERDSISARPCSSTPPSRWCEPRAGLDPGPHRQTMSTCSLP
jgi:multidrug efflux system outer membrane protein